MKIVIEGKDELLKKLERIQELSRELYKEVGGIPPLTNIKYAQKENTACDETDGE